MSIVRIFREMALEIERKFLVTSNIYKQQAISYMLFRQGYLKSSGRSVVRVRVANNKAYLTVKGENKGISRSEFEYELPIADANFMLDNLCEGYIVEKYRHIIPIGDNLTWEVDEFTGVNAGLIIAEIELKTENDFFEVPKWLGQEVSGDVRYYNSYLSEYPYTSWK